MPVTESVDFLEELRLRCWARENHCLAIERQSSWHPIIHDEMTRRDEEGCDGADVLADDSVLTGDLTDDDESTPSDSTILTDLPAEEEAASIEPVTVAATAFPMSMGPIVPLVPDCPGLHGPHEISPPHQRIEAPVASPEMYYA